MYIALDKYIMEFLIVSSIAIISISYVDLSNKTKDKVQKLHYRYVAN